MEVTPDAAMKDQNFNLTPQVPKRYHKIYSKSGRSVVALEDFGAVRKALDQSVKQGFLVVPDRRSVIAQAFSNSWWARCEQEKIPFVRVHVKKNGSGHVFFDPWTTGHNITWASVDVLCKKTDVFHRGLTEAEEKLIHKAMPNGGLYSMSHGHGFVGFCPRIAQGVTQTIVAHLSDSRNWADPLKEDRPPV